MGEEVNTSRRSFLKYLAIFLTIGAGISVYINRNEISLEQTVKELLKNLKSKLEEVKPKSKEIVSNDIENWSNEQLDKNIDKFLDWYYSIGGEIAVALYIVYKYGNKLSKLVDLDFEVVRKKEEEFNKMISEKLFDGLLEDTPEKIKLVYKEKLDEFNKEAKLKIKKVAPSKLDILNKILDKLSQKTLTRISLSLTIGGILGAFILRKISSRLARKIIFKTGSKVAARFTGSKIVSLIGLICGPAALLCTGALTVASEYVAIRIDEFFTRDSLKKELKAMIIAEINKLKPEVEKKVVLKIEEINNDIYKEAEKIFLRDLLKS